VLLARILMSGPSQPKLYRIPWCAVKVGPFNWYCLLERADGRRHGSFSNPEELLTEADKEASACNWLTFAAAVVGVVLLVGLMTFWVQREVMHVTHIEQVLGGLAAIIALGRSMAQLMRHYRQRSTGLRRFTVRILWVLPFFTIDSWVELLAEGYPGFWVMLLHCLREVAEAVALTTFMQLVLSFLGGPLKVTNLLQEQPPVEQMGFLKHLLPPYRPGANFVSKVVVGILQYAVVTPLLFVMTACLRGSLQDPDLARFHRGLLRLKAVPPLIKGVSCVCAMYHLALLRRETRQYLDKLKPVLKFLGIYCVIFLTFFQGFMVDAVGSFVCYPHPKAHSHQSELSRQQFLASMKSLLLCIEMPIFAEIHGCAYPTVSNETADLPKQSTAKRSQSGRWQIADVVDATDTPVLLVTKDDDHAPKVSRLLSREDSQDSLEALDLVDLWAEVRDLTDRAHGDRGTEVS